ncbi:MULTISPECIES: Fic family protein [Mycobacterium avium complex (MAC)]|uniref:Fic/DOC family N-terminal domain-containing protein n=1 Tax=Mycobacterium intracellulare subsp. chimaera TaxID=222805 RepID=A0A220XM57_MYCIT|nr:MULTISPECIES: Fic/DOC family N-terminal domain-containing protein [Mycobacterium avium complex (MAC)]ASL12484.1 filamentation induced by cAMP protein fic [Mycobacterium intracellulare subsp. chimaera]ASQ84229.1 filamentation induced by cAMP protein fic [Mycobacterium intracellulare subsp. chimaera]ASW98473.1 Fic family protein [Mycobacterium intracellulare subsp. chimaera]MCF1815087.1 Fic family protein [Mycobacterium intracellulare subsp. intracellulare]MDM3924593.1 Fic/DOC family N-termin
MDLEAVRQSPIGKLVPISGTDPRTVTPWEYWAYVPNALPELPHLTPRALALSAKAGAAIARLDEAVAQLPRPEILVRPIIRKEAKSTSALEGTYASFQEVLEADFLDDRQMSSEQREIRNYVEATEAACASIGDRRITRSFLGELQRMIVKRTPGDTPDAGDVRPHQVAIGSKDRPIDEARFVPSPPGAQLEGGVQAWEDWIGAESDLLIVAKVAIAHYQFETLHPFGDGNGRLGRLVAILQLMKEGELRWPVLNIAPWFEAHRDLYQEGLMQVTLTGDFSTWVELFAHAVEMQAREGLQKIQTLLSLRDEMVASLRARNLRGSAVEIAEILIGYPVIDVRTASQLIGKTFEATNVAIAKLVEHGILQEITGRSQNRLFGCAQAAWTITK